jgi:hypothetical protein
LTGRVFAGRLNKKGKFFLNQKEDVTSDFHAAVIAFLRDHNGEVEITEKKRGITIRSLRITLSEPSSPAKPCREQNCSGQ